LLPGLRGGRISLRFIAPAGSPGQLDPEPGIRARRGAKARGL
jgi:hypothetical protein